MFCDILYYPAAALNLLGLSLENCYRLIVLLINTLTIASSMFSFSKLFGSKRYGLISAALYTLSIYRLENITLRADIGEALGMAFLPLVAFSFVAMLNGEKNLAGDQLTTALPSWVIFGLSFSGVVCSNIPLTVMTALFLAISFLISLAMLPEPRSLRTVMKLAKGGALVLLLTAFYSLPFLDYYLHADLAVTAGLLKSGTRENAAVHSVNFSQLFAVFQDMAGWSNQYQQLGMPTTVGFSLILAPVSWALTCKQLKSSKTSKLFLAMACLALFMASSLFPWNTDIPIINVAIGFLAKIQFPWRFLSLATLLLAIFSGLALMETADRLPKLASLLTMMILVISALEAVYGITSFVRNNQTTNTATILSENDGIYDAQFIPAKTYRARPDFSIAGPVAITSGINITEYEKSGSTISLTVDVVSEGKVALPLLSYPYYEIQCAGDNVQVKSYSSSRGQMVLYATGDGEATIRVQFNEPLAWRLAEATSAGTLMAICINSAVAHRTKFKSARQHTS